MSFQTENSKIIQKQLSLQIKKWNKILTLAGKNFGLARVPTIRGNVKLINLPVCIREWFL